MDKISVIIPMYNAARTVARAVDSVFKQTYNASYQVVVVNDGSTDNSLRIIQEYMEIFPDRDICLINKPNGGVSSARNAGFLAAQGEWIALLDSDDEWVPEKIECQMNILYQHPNIDFLGCNLKGQQTRILWRLKKTLSPIKVWELLIKMHPQTSTAIFKRSILQDVGFYNEKMRYAEDGEYWVRICHRKNCFFLPDELVIYDGGKAGFGVSGLSANISAMQQGQRQILKNAYGEHAINATQYIFFRLYAELKYWRRKFIIRRNHNKQ